MRRALFFAVLLASLAGTATSQAGDLRVFSSGAPSLAQQAIAQADGRKINFVVAMPGILVKRLTAGEQADIIVAPEQALDALEKAGKLIPGSRTPVARVGVGIAIRQGTPRPDITTVEALRATLLAAPSIVYPDPAQPGSVAGKSIVRMMDRLGIASTVAPKTTYKQAIAGGVEMVARGEAAIGLFNISEILPIKNVTLAGPLPNEVQSYVTFTAAVIAGSTSEPAAKAYILGLSDPAAHKHWEAAGLEAWSKKP